MRICAVVPFEQGCTPSICADAASRGLGGILRVAGISRMKKLIHAPKLSPPLQSRICWRKDLAVPHESLWGRLNKLSLLNQIAGKEVEQLLMDKNRPREHSYSRGWDAGDLRVRARYDEGKLR